MAEERAAAKKPRATKVAEQTPQTTAPTAFMPSQSQEQRGVAMTMPREQTGTTALAVPVHVWTQEQIDLMKRVVSPIPLNDDEFQTFLYVAKARNLDPLQKQIHVVKRKVWNSETRSYDLRMTIQTGIDGYRAIANRTGLYMPSEKPPLIEGINDKGVIVRPLFRATVYVKKWSERDRQWHEFNATAYYNEFVQTYKKDNEVLASPMWEKMPINQLTKCAEALALRKGWPEELGDIRTDEEMAQADSPQIISPEEQKKDEAEGQRVAGKKGRERDLSTISRSEEANRGHGNEGFEKSSASTIEGEVVTTAAKSDAVEEKAAETTAPEPEKPRYDLENLQNPWAKGYAVLKKFTACKKQSTNQPYMKIVLANPKDLQKEFDAVIWHMRLQGNMTKCLNCSVGVVYRSTDKGLVIEGMFEREEKPGNGVFLKTDENGFPLSPEVDDLIESHLRSIAGKATR